MCRYCPEYPTMADVSELKEQLAAARAEADALRGRLEEIREAWRKGPRAGEDTEEWRGWLRRLADREAE